MSVRILLGDVRERLAELRDESVHCVATSPPYFGLRDYGTAAWEGGDAACDHAFKPAAGTNSQRVGRTYQQGHVHRACACGAVRTDSQIGLEESPAAYVAVMVDVFREVRRVLRSNGTLWLNLGDSLASKQLLGIPWRVAFALQSDGWYLRQDIIWAKPNPMPESVTDRCTKAHEYLFLLSKSARYHYDAAAIAEPRVGEGAPGVSGWASGDTPHTAVAHNRQKGDAKTFRGGQYVNGNKFDNSHSAARSSTGNAPATKETRNRRSVWTIASEPFSEAHFATFPPALIEPCILAGCPKGGTVLDPFFGAGTTGLVADRLGRDCIGVELNPEYAALAERRITANSILFADVTIQPATVEAA